MVFLFLLIKRSVSLKRTAFALLDALITKKKKKKLLFYLLSCRSRKKIICIKAIVKNVLKDHLEIKSTVVRTCKGDTLTWFTLMNLTIGSLDVSFSPLFEV